MVLPDNYGSEQGEDDDGAKALVAVGSIDAESPLSAVPDRPSLLTPVVRSEVAAPANPDESPPEVLMIGGTPFRVEWEASVQRLYFPSGDVYYESPHVDGKRSGVAQSWYESGGLRSEESWDKDLREGASVSYSESGAMVVRGQYHLGFMDGLWEKWAQSGQLESFGHYRSTGRAQLKVGDWLVWLPNGEIDESRSGFYEENRRIRDALGNDISSP